MDGYAWLAQAGMFLLLGPAGHAQPAAAAAAAQPGVALVLIFVARPVAVWLCLWPLRFSRAETAFIAWVGLRGAVPIVLALFPLLAGVAQAQVLFNAAFVVVLVSLLLQGSTIGWAARRLGVALPDRDDEPRARLAFGDFELDAGLPLAAVCDFYALPPPAQCRAAARQLAVGHDQAPAGGGRPRGAGSGDADRARARRQPHHRRRPEAGLNAQDDDAGAGTP
jgi:cell volume regulation protein A